MRTNTQLIPVITFLISGCRSQFPKLQPTIFTPIRFNDDVITSILHRMDFLNLHLRSSFDVDADNTQKLVRFLLQQVICPVQLSIGEDEPYFHTEQRHRALVIPSQHLKTTLSKYATRKGIFLFIFSSTPNRLELLKMARHMWTSKGVLQIYYIMPNCRQILFFNPFPRAGEQYGTLVNLASLSYDDIFTDMQGYPLRIYIFDSVYSTVFGNENTKEITSISGADCVVAEVMSKKMNFTMDLQFPNDEFFGARLENGSFNGAIGRLIRYEADITFTGFFVKDYLTRDIDFSVSVYMDELCCYVMKAKRVPQSIVPLFAVDVDMWCAFLLVGLLSPLVWILLRRINLCVPPHLSIAMQHDRQRLDHSLKLQFVRIYIDTWVVWVRVNISRFPPFYSERIFIMSLCLVSVIFGALFESSLATIYIRPLYYKDINTMQELDEANVRIYIKHAAIKDDLFYGHSSTVYQNLDRKLLLVAETEERLISMMSKRGGFAAVTRASSLVLTDIRYFITNKIHKIPECPKNYHIAFLFPSQSPLEKPINIMLLRFVQGGLIDHWIEEMKHKAKISIHNFPEYFSELVDKWKVLTLGDLQLAFYALFFGSILSSLSLLGEIALHCKISNTLRKTVTKLSLHPQFS